MKARDRERLGGGEEELELELLDEAKADGDGGRGLLDCGGSIVGWAELSRESREGLELGL